MAKVENSLRVILDDDQWWACEFKTGGITDMMLREKDEMGLVQAMQEFGEALLRRHENNPHLHIMGK